MEGRVRIRCPYCGYEFSHNIQVLGINTETRQIARCPQGEFPYEDIERLDCCGRFFVIKVSVEPKIKTFKIEGESEREEQIYE